MHPSRCKIALLVGVALSLTVLQASVAAQTSPKILLSWQEEPMPAGVKLTGFQVQACQVPVGQTTCTPVDLANATTSPTPMTYEDKSVLPGMTYCYTVVAIGTGADTPRSQASDRQCKNVPGPGPPPPRNFRATVLP